MPGLNGYEVCRRLRATPETADVPIVFLSSLDELQYKSKGFEAGGNDYLTKPFDLQEVRMRVRALLKAKCYSDAVKEQLAGDLRVAREIQMGMIPSDFRPLESAFGVEIAGVLDPAREVGGDLYSAFAGKDGRLVVLVGDVSGKGIPASLFMVRASSLARLLARDSIEPERILARLNDELSADNPSGMFVTMLCAIYDPATQSVALANAGHNRPVLLRAGEAPAWALKSMGTALGFEPDLEFRRSELQLQPGDALVLYTDGVNEAFDSHEACFGNERLLASLAPLTGQAAGAVTDGLLRDVRAFVGGAPQSDDIAILVLRPLATAPAQSRQLSLRATPADVMRSVQHLQAFGREHRVDERTLHGLAVALEECGSNIVRHAGLGEADGQFEVSMERTAEGLAIELRDAGPAFDPTQHAAPAREAGEEVGAEGGWGIQLVRHYIDEVSYCRASERNVLRLSKRLQWRRE